MQEKSQKRLSIQYTNESSEPGRDTQSMDHPGIQDCFLLWLSISKGVLQCMTRVSSQTTSMGMGERKGGG